MLWFLLKYLWQLTVLEDELLSVEMEVEGDDVG